MGKALTKADIVSNIMKRSKRNLFTVKDQVDCLLEIMKEAIQTEKGMLINGFGKFEAYQKRPRKGRNPQTNQTIVLPARKVIVFRLSRKFRAELNR